MSLWFSRKAKDGRRRLWLIDTDPLALIMVVGLLIQIAMGLPDWIRAIGMGASCAMLLMGVGWLCLLVAKISMFRNGIWFFWGPRLMSRPYARAYRVGYGMIVAGTVLLLLSWGLAA